MIVKKLLATLAFPALLAACASPWPSGSYVQVSNEDAQVIAPAIGNYLTRTLPYHSAIALDVPGSGGALWKGGAEPSPDMLTPALRDELEADGFTLAKSASHHVQYVVAPMDDGMLVRIVVDGSYGASRYFARNDHGGLQPGGPMMVVSR